MGKFFQTSVPGRAGLASVVGWGLLQKFHCCLFPQNTVSLTNSQTSAWSCGSRGPPLASQTFKLSSTLLSVPMAQMRFPFSCALPPPRERPWLGLFSTGMCTQKYCFVSLYLKTKRLHDLSGFLYFPCMTVFPGRTPRTMNGNSPLVNICRVVSRDLQWHFLKHCDGKKKQWPCGVNVGKNIFEGHGLTGYPKRKVYEKTNLSWSTVHLGSTLQPKRVWGEEVPQHRNNPHRVSSWTFSAVGVADWDAETRTIDSRMIELEFESHGSCQNTKLVFSM